MAWCLVKHRDSFTFTFYLLLGEIFGHVKNETIYQFRVVSHNEELGEYEVTWY